MPATGVLAPKIKVGGSELNREITDLLVELRVELTASAPAQLLLRFTDTWGDLATGQRFKLGTVIDVSLPEAAEPGRRPAMVPLVQFEVTEVGVDAPEGSVPELVVIAHDKSHRLGLGTVTSSFEQASASHVLTKIVQEYGMRFRSEVGSRAFERQAPYLMVADNALALLNELTARHGALWWFEDSTVVAGDPGSRGTVTLSYGTDLRSCNVRVSGRHPESVTVGGWDHNAMRRIEATESTTAQRPARFGTGQLQPRRKLLVTSARAADEAEARALAAGIARAATARCLDVRGVATSQPRLVPGGRVQITDFAPAEGTYDVQRVEHVFRPGGMLDTRFVAGERTPTSLSLDGVAGRASSIRFDGMVVAVVTDNNDPEKLGRVKVKFPWLTEEHASGWARVVAIGAGGGSGARGSQFVPEVNDEVLVGFEGGDLRKPVVLGGLYNAKTSAPEWKRDGSGKVITRSITSRLGHVIEFADGQGEDEQHVLVKLAGGATRLRVGKDRVDVETPSGKPISLKSGRASITITDKGDISIAGNKVTIAAEVQMELTAKAGIKADSKGPLSLEATGPAGIKGNPTMLGDSSVTIVKGSTVQIN
jgi:phage baseplate assembly protein gpV